MTVQIEDKLVLELTAQRHAAGLFRAVDTNRDHLSEFLPWIGNMKSVKDIINYTRNCEELHAQGKEVSFVIISGDDTVGRIGLHHMDLQNKKAEIGYWLTKNAEGNGFITKSCEALISMGFKDMQLNRIAIKAAMQNNKSKAIPEKLGFRMEGILRQAELVNGRFLDLVLYSLLKDEWIYSHHQKNLPIE